MSLALPTFLALARFNEAAAVRLRKFALLDLTLGLAFRFNEAAAVRLRKSRLVRRLRRDGLGFNEAAAVRLRKSRSWKRATSWRSLQ